MKPFLKKIVRFLIYSGLSISVFPAASAQDTFSGFWKTIDENSGKPRSIIQIWIENDELKGKIIQPLLQPGETEKKLCEKCPGEFKNKKIIGLIFMWGFKKRGNRWENGKILDVETGKIYNCTLESDPSGEKLKVFGYIRLIVKIGRTQTWERVQENDIKN